MSHKKLLLKGMQQLNKENYAPQAPYLPTPGRDAFAAIKHASTPLQSVTTPTTSSSSCLNAMAKCKEDFCKVTQNFLSKSTAATNAREEIDIVTEYEANILRFLTNFEINETSSALPSLISNNLENDVLDLSIRSSPIEPLDLTYHNTVESTEQLTKRSASYEIEQPTKLYRAMQAMEQRSLSMSKASFQPINYRTPDTVLAPNAQLPYVMGINKLPPTPAASPTEIMSEANGGLPATPTTSRAAKTPDSRLLKQELTYMGNTPAASIAGSATPEHKGLQQQRFATPHNNSCIKAQATPKQPITKVYLSMSDEIHNFIEGNTIYRNGIELVVLGDNGTTVNKNLLHDINWSISGAAITRKILMLLFDREMLATHTLSGKPSPAFLNLNKPEKGRLDPLIVSDLIQFMAATKDLSSREIRNAITTKCADEFKMLRQRVYRQLECEQLDVNNSM